LWTASLKDSSVAIGEPATTWYLVEAERQ